MNSTEIAFLSATETAKAIKTKELSPTDAVQAYLERIDRLDSRLAAYITVVREEALRAARLVAQRIGRGEDPGPLAGVPIAVKDQYWTKDILTTSGSKVYQDFVPEEDSTVIQRLRDAGSVLLQREVVVRAWDPAGTLHRRLDDFIIIVIILIVGPFAPNGHHILVIQLLFQG